jgi:hypothetical protein
MVDMFLTIFDYAATTARSGLPGRFPPTSEETPPCLI